MTEVMIEEKNQIAQQRFLHTNIGTCLNCKKKTKKFFCGGLCQEMFLEAINKKQNIFNQFALKEIAKLWMK